MSEMLSEFVNSTSGLIILAILAACTIRDIVAATGVIPRDTKILGRIVYGKYDEDLLARSLLELGYNRKEALRRHKKMKEYIKDMEGKTTVTKENAPIQLILLIAKYIVEFESSIKYGGNTESNYYINTMEIVHDREDSKILCDIMCRLIYSHNNEELDAIFVPKSGNPLLAEKIAECFNIPSVFVKDSQEKSKLHSDNNAGENQINLEGILQIKSIGKLKCPIIDCNISGGSQIKNAIMEVNREESLGIKITDVFILFRVDDGKKDVEKTFRDLNVNLYRYFDLDEKTKKDIHQIKVNAQKEDRLVDIENVDDYRQAEKIIEELKRDKRYHYLNLGHA